MRLIHDATTIQIKTELKRCFVSCFIFLSTRQRSVALVVVHGSSQKPDSVQLLNSIAQWLRLFLKEATI